MEPHDLTPHTTRSPYTSYSDGYDFLSLVTHTRIDVAHHRHHCRHHSCNHHWCCSVIHTEGEGRNELEQLIGIGQLLPLTCMCACVMVSYLLQVVSQLNSSHGDEIKCCSIMFTKQRTTQMIPFTCLDWANISYGSVFCSAVRWILGELDPRSDTKAANIFRHIVPYFVHSVYPSIPTYSTKESVGQVQQFFVTEIKWCPSEEN